MYKRQSQHVSAEPSAKKEVKGTVKLKQSPVAIPVYRSAHQPVSYTHLTLPTMVYQ
ncbi:hypothetical protein H8939_18555, partial [Bacillus pumilus]|nr:hypothetical protein [Bacillus pumilus]